MTYSEAVAYMDSLKPAGMQMGLERMEHAVKALGHPERQFPCIHIAGTNGKGSTARMLAAMLTTGGYRVGLFSSPAVTDLRDTIQLDGCPVSEEVFAACANRVSAAVPQGLSEFEFLTAVMFCCFEEQNIDIAVIECGLGGLTDATNVIPPPLCAVFTPISLDHTAILGDTIEEIAKQKSGIIKAPCDIVCSPDMSDDALGILFETAATKRLTVHCPSPCTTVYCNQSGTQFDYHRLPVRLSLIGSHQASNALTALTALQRLTAHGFSIAEEAAVTALEKVTMPCRLEIIPHSPPLFLDGAHNPQGIEALCDTIHSLFDAPITLVIGMLHDKDCERCLKALAPHCKRMLCCTPQGTSRAMPAAKLAEIAAKYHTDVMVVDDPIKAFQAAKKATQQTPIVVGGSFYTASVVRRAVYENSI